MTVLTRLAGRPVAILTAAMIGAAALIVALSWNFTFFQDAWLFVLYRRDWSLDSVLSAQNEHLVALQVIVDKLFYEAFGIGDNRTEMLFGTAAFVACGALFFFWARRHIDPRLALLGAVVLLFFGTGWQTSLWPFEVEFTVPIAAGVGMLLLLERGTRRADAWACLLLVVAVGFGSLWISFGAAALAEVIAARRRRGWSRLYVVLVPALLYLAWYVGWGREAEHHLTLHNVLTSPAYVFDGLANSCGALLGLGASGIGVPATPEWGRPILLALVALGARRIHRRGMPRAAWPPLTALLSYWLLAGFDYIPGREAESPRYVYAGAFLVLMVVAAFLGRRRLSDRAVLATAALALVTVLPNLAILQEGHEFFTRESALARGDIGALAIARDTVAPDFQLAAGTAGTPALEMITAATYLETEAQYGPAGYSPAALAEAPEIARHWADVVLAAALPISVQTAPGTASRGGCEAVGPDHPVRLRPGETTVIVPPGEPSELQLRRFALAEFPVAIATVAPGTTARLTVPPDKAPQPWYLQATAGQGARVCVTDGR